MCYVYKSLLILIILVVPSSSVERLNPPANASASQTGDGEVTISWDPPVNDGGEVPSIYRYCWDYLDDGGGFYSCSETASSGSIVYTGLAPGRYSYEIGAWYYNLDTSKDYGGLNLGREYRNVCVYTTVVGEKTEIAGSPEQEVQSPPQDQNDNNPRQEQQEPFSEPSTSKELTSTSESAPQPSSEQSALDDYKQPLQQQLPERQVEFSEDSQDQPPDQNQDQPLGDGEAADTSDAQDQPSGPVPGAVRSLEAQAVATDSTLTIRVGWYPPDTDVVITRYERRFKRDDNDWESWEDITLRRARGQWFFRGIFAYDFTGQGNFPEYSFELRACNDNGCGPETGVTPPSNAAKPVAAERVNRALSAVAAPNPFNPSTTIRIQLPVGGPTSLVIYNLAGQAVRTLWDGRPLEAGDYAVDWDSRDRQGQPVSSGVYLYMLRTGNQIIRNKITLLR